MALNFDSLNREGNWTVDQKRDIKRLFNIAETAATGGSSADFQREDVQRTLMTHFDGVEKHDLSRLMDGLRSAVDATDNAYDVSIHISASRLGGNKRRVIRALADAVVTQII